MTPEEITLVQESFKAVAPIKDKAAELFYDKLFELDPSLRPMFKPDMADQRAKLMATIGFAVASLRDLGALVPVVEKLGRDHVGYGVKPTHYDTVGTALLWTLETGLGAAFTPEVKSSWTSCYGLLASVMKKAAYGAA